MSTDKDLDQMLNQYREMLGVPKHVKASDHAALNYYVEEIANGTVIVDHDEE